MAAVNLINELSAYLTSSIPQTEQSCCLEGEKWLCLLLVMNAGAGYLIVISSQDKN